MRLRLSEGDSGPDMKQVGSGVRGSEVNQPQLASSSQESDPTPPTPSAGGAKRDQTTPVPDSHWVRGCCSVEEPHGVVR